MMSKQIYDETGYQQYPNFYPVELRNRLTQNILDVILYQAKKLGVTEPMITDWCGQNHPQLSEKLDQVITYFYAHDVGLVDEAMQILKETPAGRACTNEPTMLAKIAELLDCPADILVIRGPNVRVHMPHNKKRAYTWHSEAHWYPKRRRFTNIWIPFFRPKTENNGAMYIKEKSHHLVYDFSEFVGFDQKSQGDANYLLQYEVSETDVSQFSDFQFVGNPGDTFMFDRNVVHRSSLNETDLPSYSLEFRAYDYREDFTIGSKTGERPYNQSSAQYGRSGFKIRSAEPTMVTVQ